jgi:hypothetical protein
VEDDIRDLHVCALDGELHLLDVSLSQRLPSLLIDALGSVALIVVWPSSNHYTLMTNAEQS